MVPILVMLIVWEDAGSHNSPRRGWWKNKIQIPDFNDWMMFEIVNTANAQKQDRGPKQKDKYKKNETTFGEEKVETEETSLATIDGDDDDDEEMEDQFDEKAMEDRRRGYWINLKPILYKNAKQAKKYSFKKFMQTHIRYYLPGHY